MPLPEDLTGLFFLSLIHLAGELTPPQISLAFLFFFGGILNYLKFKTNSIKDENKISN